MKSNTADIKSKSKTETVISPIKSHQVYPWLQDQYNHIQRLIINHRLPSVILLHGQSGVGKTSFALSLAKSLNSDIYSNNILGHVHEHSSEDFKTATKISIKIDEIRALINKSEKTSPDNKVNVILNIENLTESAANCLLKILESGLEKTYFILTTSDSSRILPTILSRSYKINLMINNSNNLDIALSWLQQNHMANKHQQMILLELANYGPLRALELYKDNYLDKLNIINDIISSIITNSNNIVKHQKAILELFKYKDSDKKSKFNLAGCLLVINYILNNLLKNKLASQNKINDLLLGYNKRHISGLALDNENIIYNILYSIVEHEKV